MSAAGLEADAGGAFLRTSVLPLEADVPDHAGRCRLCAEAAVRACTQSNKKRIVNLGKRRSLQNSDAALGDLLIWASVHSICAALRITMLTGQRGKLPAPLWLILARLEFANVLRVWDACDIHIPCGIPCTSAHNSARTPPLSVLTACASLPAYGENPHGVITMWPSRRPVIMSFAAFILLAGTLNTSFAQERLEIVPSIKHSGSVRSVALEMDP